MASQGLTDEEVSAVCKEGHPMTQDYMMQQTTLRVKDPARSLNFYTGILGMTLLQKIDFPAMSFTLYFLGYEDKANIPEEKLERTAWTFSRHGLIELLHNWGAQKDKDLKYHHGNKAPLGFGHIGISVPNLTEACSYFEKCGVTFVKKAYAGKTKNLAFIQDPDGYWIEILNPKNMCEVMSQ
ncbi:lactoylglutathione lyase-like [Periophthalmus magnuspinnatus]|uniref:lactoylglutathione lyase-like n=1 Tax=Periophthalmus magnuspinnatus TaxID=409849 RepID=UPI002436F0F1|nr:lactoylglutathione lyase-like [Periophthalmus magnuspinnatus]